MFFSPLWHWIFDISAFLASTLMFRHLLKSEVSKQFQIIDRDNQYWKWLSVGAIFGAYLFGSINLSLAGALHIGHSIAGAFFGAIFSVEIYKIRNKINFSTGFIFVVPISLGVAIGRIGCFMSGLADETYGIPTQSFLGIDFGDQIPRHPVQLYESVAMMFSFLFFYVWRKKNFEGFSRHSFYVFIVFYASQRFLWEFLKPYKSIFFVLNLFHLLCLLMFIYGATMLLRKRGGKRG